MKNFFEILSLSLFTFMIFYLLIEIAGDPIIDGIGILMEAAAPLTVFFIKAFYLIFYIIFVVWLIYFGFEVKTWIMEWSQNRDAEKVKQKQSNQEFDIEMKRREAVVDGIRAGNSVVSAKAQRIASLSFSRTVPAGAAAFFHDPYSGEKGFFQNPVHRPPMVHSDDCLLEDDIQKEQEFTILDAVDETERGFVVGGTRSGKTFFCKQDAYRRILKGQIVYVLDPKDFDPADPWPEGCRIFGNGDNFDAMELAFFEIDSLKAERGKNLKNIRRQPFVMIYFDEINDTLFERPDFKERYLRILRKYAQYRIGITCIGQADTVESIGLKGLNQLKTCFDFKAKISHNKRENKRLSWIKYSDDPDFMNDSTPGRACVPYKPVTFSAALPWSMGGDSDGEHRTLNAEHRTSNGDTVQGAKVQGAAGNKPDRRPGGGMPDNNAPMHHAPAGLLNAPMDHYERQVITVFKESGNITRTGINIHGYKSPNNNKKIREILKRYGYF